MREEHSGTFDCGVERVVSTVEAEAVTDINTVHAGRLEPIGPGWHLGTIGERVVMDQRHAFERFRHREGPVRLDQLRAAHWHEGQLDQLLDHKLGVGGGIDR
jgi:hypothetical protein